MLTDVYRLRVYFSVLLIFWTCLIVWQVRNQYRNFENTFIDIATKEADSNYYKDSLLRNWIALNGGVYVIKNKHTPPNKYLYNVEHRDIMTVDGLELTLINPSYMIQLIFEMEGHDVTHGHLKSKTYINPANKPDEWESEALSKIYAGASSVSMKTEINNKPYLRFMKPYVVEGSCMKCHKQQDYSIGDIKGGISFDVPMTDYYKALNTELNHTKISGIIIWLFGFFLLIFMYKYIRKGQKQKQGLIKYKEKLFREFNHRVRNNFQIISTIIDDHIDIEDISQHKSMLKNIQTRLISMSSLHNIFTANNYIDINLKSYICDFCNSFTVSHEIANDIDVEFNLDIDEIIISNSKALSCGLIINELLTNTYKHAFGSLNIHPEINITITKIDDVIHLIYTDNGKGFNYHKAINAEGSYGIMLINTIAENLNAKIDINGDGGFFAKFEFNA